MDRTTELEGRDICRICLTQEESANFSDIFDDSTLTIQLLSVGSVEVFPNDGMPHQLCSVCKTILGNAYKFKQICKRSDTLLKMYPITGNVPPKIEIPQDMLPASTPTAEKPVLQTKSVGVGSSEAKTFEESSTQTDPEVEEEAIIAPPDQFLTEMYDEPKTTKMKVYVGDSVKILNKSTPESAPKQFRKTSAYKVERVEFAKPMILNSQLQGQSKGEETYIDSIESTDDGSIQIISVNEEYLDEGDLDNEPKFAVYKDDPPADISVVHTCKECGRSFPLLQQLEIHRKNHARARNHPCLNCDKSFFSKYDLAKHVLTHTKVKDYTCIVCNKSFSRSTLLYRHEKIHNDMDVPRYHCVECDRVYLNPLDYEKHSITHSKQRNHECHFCGKRFAYKQGLERHITIHDNDAQPNPCQYCDLRFPSASRLQRHLSKEHAGTRPYPCGKCSKRFMLSHHLCRHMKTTHGIKEEAVQYQCQECEEIFIDRDDFFSHCLEHAEETLTCPLCRMTFEHNKDAAEHIAAHSVSDMYYCDYCNSIFMNQDDLNHHFMDQHSEELCSVGEEFEYIVEDKDDKPKSAKRTSNSVSESSAKKFKSAGMSYEVKELDNESYEYLDNEQYVMTSDIDGAGFVEYEEVESYEPPAKAPEALITKKPIKKIVKEEIKKAATIQTKKVPVKPQVIRMSPAKIEQLKKEGKIEMRDGNLVMRQ